MTPTQASDERGQFAAIADVEKRLARLDVELRPDWRRLLERMTIRELMRLVVVLSAASPHNAASHLVQALVAADLERDLEAEEQAERPAG